MYTNTAARQPGKQMNYFISLQFHGFLASGSWNVLGEANIPGVLPQDVTQLPPSLLQHCPFDQQDMQNRYLHVQQET